MTSQTLQTARALEEIIIELNKVLNFMEDSGYYFVFSENFKSFCYRIFNQKNSCLPEEKKLINSIINNIKTLATMRRDKAQKEFDLL